MSLTAEGSQGIVRAKPRAGDRIAPRTGLDVIKLLSRRELCYCVLHGWESAATYPSSDVDIVVSSADLGRLEETLRNCADGRLVQLLQHEASCYYFVLAVRHGGEVRLLTLDTAVDYRVDGCVFFAGKDLLEHRRRVDGLWVASPATEFAYLLVKKICKTTLPERQRVRLHVLQGQLGAEAEAIALRTLGARWGHQVSRCIARLDWATLEVRWRSLKRALQWQVVLQHPLNPIHYWVPDLRRKWQRWCNPSGLFVAVLGSDGSGKSTLVDHLKKDLARAFRSTRVSHLRPRLFEQTVPQNPVTDPHGRAVYPLWISWLKIFYYVLAYALGYLSRIRPRLARSTLVLFDRYYDDLLVDPRRYRYGGSMRLARFARRFIRKPDLVLILDVPAAQALERKQEISREELQRQREAYRQLAADLPNAVLLDGSLPADDVARIARDVVLDYLHRRYMHRRSMWFPNNKAETLKWLTEVLFPPSVSAGWAFSAGPPMSASRPGSREFGWLPLENGRGYLIPLDSRRTAANALDLYNAQSRKARLAKAMLAAGLRCGIGGRWPRKTRLAAPPEILKEERTAAGLIEFLGDIVGRGHLSVAISLGTPGPHRKPVLLILSDQGKPLAYVKVGADDVTNSLVQREVETLGHLAGKPFRSFAAPVVLHSGWWNGRYVCVESALPEGRTKRVSGSLTAEYLDVTMELAASSTCRLPLTASEFWKRLQRQVDNVSQICYRDSLERGIRSAEKRLAGELLPFHLNHGDFAPWNMKVVNGKIFIFDWEHANMAGLPAWDLFHFIFETMRVRGRGPREIYAAFFKERVFCTRLGEYFGGVALSSTARAPLLFLYLLARLASWAVERPEHVARFEELQTLTHILRMLEPAM